MYFSKEELGLISIYKADNRLKTIAALSDMHSLVEDEDRETAEMTDGIIEKLNAISETAFRHLDLRPEYEK